MSEIAKDFFDVENVLQHRREHQASVYGKDTPYRVEFRYGARQRSYQYFTCEADAERAKDRSASYSFTGRAVIRQPSSQRIQYRGPRGGWNSNPSTPHAAQPKENE